jgi:hypothetical protein
MAWNLLKRVNKLVYGTLAREPGTLSRVVYRRRFACEPLEVRRLLDASLGHELRDYDSPPSPSEPAIYQAPVSSCSDPNCAADAIETAADGFSNSVNFTNNNGDLLVPAMTQANVVGTINARTAVILGSLSAESIVCDKLIIGAVEPAVISVSAQDWAVAGTAGITAALGGDGKLHFYRTGTTFDIVPPQYPANGMTIHVVGRDNIDDQLTVDYGNGNPIPGVLNFDGGIGGYDTLVVQNTGGFRTITSTFTGPDSGILLLTGNSSSTIRYSNLEPIYAAGSTPDDLIFTFPGTGNDLAILEDFGGNQSRIRSLTGAFESVIFPNPANSLTINLGDGDDILAVTALDPGFNANLIVNGEAGSDQINIQARTGTKTYTIDGGSGVGENNSLTGPDANITWNITGANAGNLGGVGVIDFINIENLHGGNAADSFALAGGALTGAIDGGLGVNSLQGDNVANSWTINSLNGGTVTGVAGGFANIENLVGGNAGDTLSGPNAAINAWNITGTNAGSVAGVSFSGFENLVGGTLIDNFVFSNGAGVSGNIDGGTGSDTLDFSGYTSSVTETLTALGTSGFNGTGTGASLGFNNIDVIKSGVNTGDTLTGTDGPGVWNLDAIQTYVRGFATIAFSGFETLQGGAFSDTFNILADTAAALKGGAGLNSFVFSDGKILTGSIDGGSDSGWLNLSAYTSVITATLTAPGSSGFNGTGTGMSLGFSNIDNILSGGNSGDILTGDDAASDWNLTVLIQSYVSGGQTATFSGFETLQGGSGVDAFNVLVNTTEALKGGSGNDHFVFSDGKTLTGDIDGEADSDTLDYAAYTTAISVNLQSSAATGIGGTFAGIESVVGGGNSDSLTGPNANNTWNITGTNAGTVAGVSFSGIENLVGGTLVDSFVFSNGAGVSGNIDGKAGGDTLDYTAYSTAVAVNLQGSTATGIGGTLAGIESVVGGSNAGDSLTGRNTTSVWNLNGIQTYIGSGQTVTFSGFEILQGGSDVDAFNLLANTTGTLKGGGGDDRFVFSDGKSLSGGIDGETGSDTLDYAAYATPVTASLPSTGLGAATNVSGGHANIENFVGGAANDVVDVGPLATAVRSIAGGSQIANPPGDKLNFDAQAQAVALTSTSITAAGYQAVIYNTIETLNVNNTSGNAVVLGTSGDDTLSSIPINGSSIQCVLNSGPTVTLNGISAFQFDAGNGNDLMIVGMTPGGVLPAGGVIFNGQGETGAPGDRLRVAGSGNAAVYAPSTTTQGSGTVTVDGRAISFTGLEPLDITGMATATVLFSSLHDVVTLGDGTDYTLSGANPAIRVTGTSNGVPFESVALWSNATVVVDTTAGNDTVTVNGASVAHNVANLRIDTTINSGSVSFNGPVTFAGNLTITSGTISNTPAANVDIANNASFSGASIALGNQAGDSMNFGFLTFNSGGAVTVEENSGMQLTGNSTANGLTLISTDSIANTAGASLTATNNAAFSGTSIALGDQSGDTMNFGSLTFNSGGAVTVEEDSDTSLTGSSTANTFVLKSIGSIAVGGTVNISDTSAMTAAGAITVGGSFNAGSSVMTAGTSITNTAGASLTVANNAAFSGTLITLGDKTSPADAINFGSLTFNSSGAVTVEENSSTSLTGSSKANGLILISTDSIANANAAGLTITNNAYFSGASIALGNKTPDMMNFGSLTFNSTGSVTVEENSGMLLAGINTAYSLVLKSAGAIINADGAKLTVADNAAFSGTSITLGDKTSPADSINFGSLTFNSAGAVVVEEDSPTSLTGSSKAGSLILKSAASITNTDAAGLTVTNNAYFSGTSIALGDKTSPADSMNFGSLTFNSGGAVTVEEDSDTSLTGSSTADSLILKSAGLIDGASLTVINHAAFSGASIALGGAMNFGSLTFNSGGTVWIHEDSDTYLTGSSTAGYLVLNSAGSIAVAGTVNTAGSSEMNSAGSISIGGTMNIGDSSTMTAAGAITNSAGAVLSVIGNADFSAGSIILGNQLGDTLNFGFLRLISPGGAITVEEDSSMYLTDVAAGTLNLTSNGAMTSDWGGGIFVEGTTTLAAGLTNDIDLEWITNDFVGPVTVVSARNVRLVDANAFLFGNMTLAGNLTVLTGTNLTLPAGVALSNAGNTPFGWAGFYVGWANSGSTSEIRGVIRSQVQVHGGTGDDTLNVYLQTAQLPQGLFFNGWEGSDTLLYSGTDASEIFAVQDGVTGTIKHTTTFVPYNAAAPSSDVTLQYADIETLRINALGGDDRITFSMAQGLTPPLVQIDGGAGTNGFRVIGSTGGDEIVVGDYNATDKHPTPYSYTYSLDNGVTSQTLSAAQCFQVKDIALLQLFGDGGDDELVNNVKVLVRDPANPANLIPLPSLLDGGAGNDSIVGGGEVDVIFGGLGAEKMWGGAGNDYIFADADFEYYKPDYRLFFPGGVAPNPAIGYEVGPDNGDYMDGGLGSNSIVSKGTDTIKAGSYILFNGGYIDVFSWLTGNLGIPNASNVNQLFQTVAGMNFVQPFPASPI